MTTVNCQKENMATVKMKIWQLSKWQYDNCQNENMTTVKMKIWQLSKWKYDNCRMTLTTFKWQYDSCQMTIWQLQNIRLLVIHIVSNFTLGSVHLLWIFLNKSLMKDDSWMFPDLFWICSVFITTMVLSASMYLHHFLHFTRISCEKNPFLSVL